MTRRKIDGIPVDLPDEHWEVTVGANLDRSDYEFTTRIAIYQSGIFRRRYECELIIPALGVIRSVARGFRSIEDAESFARRFLAEYERQLAELPADVGQMYADRIVSQIDRGVVRFRER